MGNLDGVLEECYISWRDIWDLDDMTPRDIYEAGFRHGVDEAGTIHETEQETENA
jgi:hypothetical protein